MATSDATSAVTIRALREDDVEAAVDMFAGVVDEGLWVGTEAPVDRVERVSMLERMLARPESQRMLVVELTDSGAIVGNGSTSLSSYGVADVGMALAARWRGQRIGGRLLDGLIAESRDLGAHKVALQVWPHNARGLSLYRSRGFVEEGRLVRHYRRANGELWDAVVMGLVLDYATPGSPHGTTPLVS
jgi:L-amino acid N-acyltransferase YncA